jgi:hypothetical protein
MWSTELGPCASRRFFVGVALTHAALPKGGAKALPQFLCSLKHGSNMNR